MFCPICKTEYREGFTRCVDCGADLVTGSPSQEGGEKTLDAGPELVWRGGDPVSLSRVTAALSTEGINFLVRPTQDHLVFELGIPRPRYVVLVSRKDYAAALGLVADIPDRSPFADFEAIESPPFYRRRSPTQETAPAESTATDGGVDTVLEEWKPSGQDTEVWSGNAPELVQSLVLCLQENGIPCFPVTEPGETSRILVHRGDERRAREIVCEVIEGEPSA